MSKYQLRRANGTIEGPMSSSELRALASAGQIAATDEICVIGTNRWVPASRVSGIKEIIAPPIKPDTLNEDTRATWDESGFESGPIGPGEAFEWGAGATPPPVPPAVPGFDASNAPPPPAPASSARQARGVSGAGGATPPPPSGPQGPARSSAGSPDDAGKPAPADGVDGNKFSDRVLRGAFRFARAISVLVIIACTLALLGSLALAGYGLMPVMPVITSEAIDTPSLAEFVEDCAPVTISRENREAREEPRATEEGERIREDTCARYREDIQFAMSRLQLASSAESILCRTVNGFPEEYRTQFSEGLRELAERYESQKPRGDKCEGVDAVNWYVQSFKERIEAEKAEKELAEIAAAAKRVERRSLVALGLSVAGGAVLVLLAFLFLPLLIQIERNTRQLVLD